MEQRYPCHIRIRATTHSTSYRSVAPVHMGSLPLWIMVVFTSYYQFQYPFRKLFGRQYDRNEHR